MKVARLEWKPIEPATTNARRVLPKMVRDYFKAGRKLDEHSSARDRHGFRLKTKQLRYTLEAFVSLYGPGLEEKIAALRPIQNLLGDANDCEVLLAESGEHLPGDVQESLAKRRDEKRKEFLQYWQKEFDTDSERKKWERYLTRAARSPKVPASKATATKAQPAKTQPAKTQPTKTRARKTRTLTKKASTKSAT